MVSLISTWCVVTMDGNHNWLFPIFSHYHINIILHLYYIILYYIYNVFIFYVSFSLVETLLLVRTSRRDHCPGMRNVYSLFPSVAEKYPILKLSKSLITWRISSQAEISARLLKQILLKSNCSLHGEGFSPGRNSARAKNPSLVSSNRARIFSPAKRAEKSM